MNEKNLIRPEDLTPSERRENARKAGKASAAARRKKKSMREKMRMLLDLPACNNDLTDLKLLGVDDEECNNEMVILKALFLKAASGDVPAEREIRNILGKDNASDELAIRRAELKLKEKAIDKPGSAEPEIIISGWDELGN